MKEVLNNDLKNIGYIINFDENNLYLPNNPSDKIDIPHVFINSIEFKNNYILDYEFTKYALSKLRDLTNNEINNIALSKINR